jgi:hypothetical protein
MARNGSGTYTLPTGNPVASGTVISSTTHNNTMTDVGTALTNSVARNGEAPFTADQPMGDNKITGLKNPTAQTDATNLLAIQHGTGVYGATVGGSGNAITVTLSPAITAYAAGQKFSFIAGAANTGGVTINFNGLGAKAITKVGTTALVANDILSSSLVEVEYDGTRFQLISPIGADPSGTYLPLAGGTLTGDLNMSAKAINEATHTEAAHATTSDIWTGGNTCLLSGSVVTFTDVADAPAVGAVRYVVANAAHVITDNSALEVDGNANYTCAVGDLLRFEAKTTSTFRVSVVAHGDGGGSGDAKTANPLSQFAATTSAQLAGVISNETGSGLLVFGTSPTLVTPALGTPSALVGTNISGTAASLTAGNVTTNANLTGHITSSGNAAVLGSFTSAQLKAALTNETGSGAAVFAESPTLVTPALGTPASGVATNLTGTASGLTSGNVTTNANLTGHITSSGNAAVLGSFTSAQLATALTNETGSGAACFATAPTIVGLTATGDITMSGKAVNEAVHTEAAHATTSDIWTGGNTCLLSGSVVTFTDVADAPQAGAVRFVVANAAHVITDNSALEVDGNANYTCGIGDVLMFTAKTTSTFRVNILSHGDTTGDYVPSAVAITGGTINGTTIGASTPAAGNFTSLDATGVASATTFEPDGDTSASDNAAIGYTAAEGLILTGQGSTTDVTIKNDADAKVMGVLTGTTTAAFEGEVTATGFTGTLDGVLGGGTPAAATTTTLNATGVATLRSEIDESSAYTGQLVIDSVTKSAGHLARILFEHDDHGSASIASDYESAGYGNLILSTRGGGNPTERMRIKGDGKVGIGTSSPLVKNHTLGAGTAVVSSGSDGAAEAIIEGANIAMTSSYGNLNVISNTAQAADTGGQIAFAGKSTDSSNVYATWGVIKGAKENGTSANIASYLAFSTRANGGGNTEKLRITSSGTIQIGVATTNSSASSLTLKVASGGATGVAAQIASDSGTSYPWSNYNTSGTYVGGITCTSSATAFATSSDVRLKKDIKDAPSAVEKIKAARVVSHEWKEEDTAPVEFGFVAQELIKVVPQAVIEGKDKEDGGIEIPWGVDYSKLVPLLVKTIQELEARIAVLEAK